MNVAIFYMPALNTAWLKLSASWLTRIDVGNGVDWEWYHSTRPTARQIRQWKKKIPPPPPLSDSGGCCCFECMNRRGLA